MSSSEKLFLKTLFEISSHGISNDFLPLLKTKLLKDCTPKDTIYEILADIMCTVDECGDKPKKDLTVEMNEANTEKLISLGGFLKLLNIDKNNYSVYNQLKSKIHYDVRKKYLKNHASSKKKSFRISELTEYVKIYLNEYDKIFEENMNKCYKSKSVIN